MSEATQNEHELYEGMEDIYSFQKQKVYEKDKNNSEDVVEEFKVKEEDLASKEGNYIFTIGNAGSGKSTMQNLMIYRLWTKDDIIFEYGTHVSDHRHNAILQKWVDNLKQGVLPKRTDQETVQEFSVTFGQKNKKKLDLNFIEISGENIKSIVPSADSLEPPEVHPILDRYLSSDNDINKRFIFVSDGQVHKRGAKVKKDTFSEDVLFDTFLRYLLSDTQKGLRRINLLFVISKWDLIRNEYKNDPVRYLKKNFPQTKSILDGERVSYMVLSFSVGKIEVKDVDGEKKERIVALENTYVDRLIQWIYHTFTNETLKGFPPIKPSLLYRIAKILGVR